MEDNLIKMLVTHEGLRLKPYLCTSGKLTIGVGRNLDDVGITEEEALYLLKNDVVRVLQELQDNLLYWEDLIAVRKEVLADMCFNLGLARFLRFRKMLAALDQKNYIEAAAEMLDSRWAQQVGQRAQTLAQMMRNGQGA